MTLQKSSLQTIERCMSYTSILILRIAKFLDSHFHGNDSYNSLINSLKIVFTDRYPLSVMPEDFNRASRGWILLDSR